VLFRSTRVIESLINLQSQAIKSILWQKREMLLRRKLRQVLLRPRCLRKTFRKLKNSFSKSKIILFQNSMKNLNLWLKCLKIEKTLCKRPSSNTTRNKTFSSWRPKRTSKEERQTWPKFRQNLGHYKQLKRARWIVLPTNFWTSTKHLTPHSTNSNIAQFLWTHKLQIKCSNRLVLLNTPLFSFQTRTLSNSLIRNTNLFQSATSLVIRIIRTWSSSTTSQETYGQEKK